MLTTFDSGISKNLLSSKSTKFKSRSFFTSGLVSSLVLTGSNVTGLLSVSSLLIASLSKKASILFFISEIESVIFKRFSKVSNLSSN